MYIYIVSLFIALLLFMGYLMPNIIFVEGQWWYHLPPSWEVYYWNIPKVKAIARLDFEPLTTVSQSCTLAPISREFLLANSIYEDHLNKFADFFVWALL